MNSPVLAGASPSGAVPWSQPAISDRGATPTSPPRGTAVANSNIQHWEDVADLPWAEAFLMAGTPAPAPPAPLRRRADTRSLADVVAEMVGVAA